MKTSSQVLLIKIVYILIIFLALAYNFSDLRGGFIAGINEEPPVNSNFFSFVCVLLCAITGITIVLKLYTFINSTQDNKVFTVINIERVSALGWYCIVQSFLLYAFYFSKSDFSGGLSYQSIIAINFDFWLLIFGVTLLTIGFVFKKGISLQQEQELTI